jgi:hypothetical protein
VAGTLSLALGRGGCFALLRGAAAAAGPLPLGPLPDEHALAGVVRARARRPALLLAAAVRQVRAAANLLGAARRRRAEAARAKVEAERWLERESSEGISG